MNKKLGIAGITITVFVIVVTTSSLGIDLENEKPNEEIISDDSSIILQSDIIMPNKVSRPGCEKTNSCYIPSKFVISKGNTITWKNDDVAFHSVTGGTYENPNHKFDSGHLDPGEYFTLTFEELGTQDYFCKLHPWMKGQITVE